MTQASAGSQKVRILRTKKNYGDAHRRAGASMSSVLGNIFHSDFERDAIMWDRISFGKDGNHLCRGFDRPCDFFAPGGPLRGRYTIIVQSYLHDEAIIFLGDTGG